jgi:regulator-associated protein of mTOR
MRLHGYPFVQQITYNTNTGSVRLLVHYNGHGVPRPTEKGELWAYGRNYTHYMPVSMHRA